MAGLLLVLFLIVPIVELYVLIQVGSWLGALPTLSLLVLVSVAGAWLVKREGIGIWRRIRDGLEQGDLPTRELTDGFLVLLAGALMLTPGFVTDVVALVLLFPPTRALVRTVFAQRFKARVEGATVGQGSGRIFAYRTVYDVQDVGDVTPPEWRGTRSDRTVGELGGP